MSRLIPPSVPLLPVTLAFVAGILCGAIGWGTISIIVSTVAIVFLIFFRQTYLAVIAGGIFFGAMDATLFIPLEPNTDLEDGTVFIAGTVNDVKETESGQRLVLRAEKTGRNEKELYDCRSTDISVYIPGFNPEIRQYDRLEFKAQVERICPRKDIPDELDYSEFLIRDHIYQQVILSPDSILRISPGNVWRCFFVNIRSGVDGLIFSSNLDTDSKILLSALFTGNKDNLPENDYESFRNSGIAHILAISGLHVCLIAFWTNLFLWPFMALRLRKWRIVAVIGVIWLFTLVTGLSPSAVRASVFASVVMFGSLLQRKSSPFNTLCLAALIILVFSPADLFDIGFQLSFAAVAGILLFAGLLNPVSRSNAIGYMLVSVVTVSVGATLGTAAIVMYYFHTFPVYFIVANVVVSMILPLLFGTSFILFLFSTLGVSCNILTVCVDKLTNILFVVTEWLSELPGAHIDNIYLPVIAVILYLAVLLAIRLYMLKGKGYCLALALAGIIICSILAFSENSVPRPAALYFLRNSARTDFIVDDGKSNGLILISTSKSDVPDDILENANWKLTDYIGRRNIDSISYVKGIPSEIVLPDKRRVVVESGINNSDDSSKTDYLIICRGFRSDLNEIVKKYNPDTVILSFDLNPIRAKRYKNSCQIPIVDLRETPFSIHF